MIRSVTCILSYPSGKKQPPKRDIIGLKFQGVLAMQNTISIHVGNTSSIIHNNRKTENHTNPDIDVSRSGNNITLVQENIKDSYEKLFGQAVDEYNAKQKRADRKINNYLQKVKDSALDHQKEFIMQIGDYQSLEKIAEEQGCKVWETQEWQLRAETLKQAVLDFQVQNPNLYVYNAVIHLDELNPHAHVNFIPVGDNMKKGLSKQVSMNRALENMGYDAKFEVSSEAKNVKERGRIKLDNSKNFKNWRDDNLERVKEIAKEVYHKAGHEFEFVEGDKSNQHESVQAYKKTVEAAKEKSSQIIQESLKMAESVENEAKASKEELYSEWEKDWDKTIREFPDFKIDELTVTELDCFEDLYSKGLDFEVNRSFPRQFNLAIKDVVTLFKEKYSQLKDYIASKWQNLSHRETEIEKRENTISEKETSLKSKLEGIEEEIGFQEGNLENIKRQKNIALARTVEFKALARVGFEIKGRLAETEPDIKVKEPLFGEKTVTMPYWKYEKMKVANWRNPFAEAYNEFHDKTSGMVAVMAKREEMLEEKVSSLRTENSTLSKENASLSEEKFQSNEDYIGLNNVVVGLMNEDKISKKDLINHADKLPKRFSDYYDIPIPKKETPKPNYNHDLDKGFGLHL